MALTAVAFYDNIASFFVFQ